MYGEKYISSMKSKYPSSMRKTTMYLDEPTYERLRQVADATGRTQAHLIRDAIEQYVFGKRSGTPRSIGLGSGPADLSERADELLAGMGEEE